MILNETIPAPDPDITERARQWLMEAFDHPLWKGYVRDADDEGDCRQAGGGN